MSVSPYYFGLDDFTFPVVGDGIVVSGDDARIVQACDMVAAAIQAALPVGDGTTVTRAYLPTVNLETITGRHLIVYPLAYTQADVLTRTEDVEEHLVGVLVAEKYTAAEDVAGTGAPRDWIDERVKFVQDYVYDLVGTARVGDMTPEVLAESAWPETAEVAAVYDDAVLAQHKVFWSISTFAFRRDLA